MTDAQIAHDARNAAAKTAAQARAAARAKEHRLHNLRQAGAACERAADRLDAHLKLLSNRRIDALVARAANDDQIELAIAA